MRVVTMALAALLAGCLRTPEYKAAPGNGAGQEVFERDAADCQARMIAAGLDVAGGMAYRQNCMRARGWVQTN